MINILSLKHWKSSVKFYPAKMYLWGYRVLQQFSISSHWSCTAIVQLLIPFLAGDLFRSKEKISFRAFYSQPESWRRIFSTSAPSWVGHVLNGVSLYPGNLWLFPYSDIIFVNRHSMSPNSYLVLVLYFILLLLKVENFCSTVHICICFFCLV